MTLRGNIINPDAADIFRTISYSFEARIANAISSSKWRKIFMFMNKYTSPKFKD